MKTTQITELSENRAVVSQTSVHEIDGETITGKPHLLIFTNSNLGRKKLDENTEIPESFKAAIYAVFGDTPAVADPEIPKPKVGETNESE
jgi:hypothetical protein